MELPRKQCLSFTQVSSQGKEGKHSRIVTVHTGMNLRRQLPQLLLNSAVQQWLAGRLAVPSAVSKWSDNTKAACTRRVPNRAHSSISQPTLRCELLIRKFKFVSPLAPSSLTTKTLTPSRLGAVLGRLSASN